MLTLQAKPQPLVTASAARRSSTQTTTQRSRKRIITSDDESAPGVHTPTDVTEEPSLSPNPTAAKEVTSSMTRATDQAAMEAMLDMGMSDDDDNAVDAKPKPPTKQKPPTSKAAESTTSKSGRKRRVVKKSKTEIDEKGYMGE
jgi:DNA polymerase delta subunit 3